MRKKILDEMLEEISKAPDIYRPSQYWIDVGKAHAERLLHGGFQDFKRSINLKYFNWGILGILRHQLLPVIIELRRGNFAPIFGSRLVNPKSNTRVESQSINIFHRFMYAESYDLLSSFIYRVYTSSLWEYVLRGDRLHILSKIEEPSMGNPFLVSYKQKSISQDLCNSVHEFYSITENIDMQRHMDVAELGAGYGRLAYIFLKMLPQVSYTIVDIPPALFISQEYLSRVFPKEKIFYFRPFRSFREVKREFESARIRFVMAHQIEYLPDKYFDHMFTISSLQEMTRKQIRNYIVQVDRLTKELFYMKQWLKSRASDNMYISQREYPIPKKWQTIFERHHPIQRMFFEAQYKIGKSS